MTLDSDPLFKAITRFYDPTLDFPMLYRQSIEFMRTRPLQGVKVLHATPLFLNTLAKILPLSVGGADLLITPTPGIPYDPEAVTLLKSLGYSVVVDPPLDHGFDVVVDCVGNFSAFKSTFGATELTRSGAGYYAHYQMPCVFVDDSRIKLLEDILGTSDGFKRTCDQVGIALEGKRVTLFGFGKVGKGVYLRLKSEKALITVVDLLDSSLNGWNVEAILFSELDRVEKVLQASDLVVTATGVKNALSGISSDILVSGNKILINMGAEDEYGEGVPKNRVFNRKLPANFVLKEPTQLKYLDAPFALQNLSILDLVTGTLRPGIQKPSYQSEGLILQQVKNTPTLWNEIIETGIDRLFIAPEMKPLV